MVSQITDFVKTKKEIQFAVDQLRKDNICCEIRQRESDEKYAVFRLDPIPPKKEPRITKEKTANASSLLEMPANRFGQAVTEILQGKRQYSFMKVR